MARTTDVAVEGIIETEVDIPLTPFIEVANALVTEKCLESSYSDERLELIERWLSAHFYAVRDLRRRSEGVDGVNESFAVGQLGKILESTMYGQMAMLLDTAGNLAALSKATEEGKPTVGIFWLGTPLRTTEES